MTHHFHHRIIFLLLLSWGPVYTWFELARPPTIVPIPGTYTHHYRHQTAAVRPRQWDPRGRVLLLP